MRRDNGLAMSIARTASHSCIQARVHNVLFTIIKWSLYKVD